MPLGLTTILVLGRLILFSCSTSASFAGHSEYNIESKLLNLPRGDPHHDIDGHQNKARSYQKRTEGVIVEVPYTIWTGTFADLIKRSPGAAFDDKHPESKKKDDKVLCLDASDPDCPKNIACWWVFRTSLVQGIVWLDSV